MSTLIWTLLLYSVFLIEKAYTTLQTIDLNGQWVITDESLAWAGSSSDSSPEKGIGLSLLSHTRLVFDLKTTTNGLEKSKFTDIKVGFRTSKKQGILLQMQSTQGDYISLKMNNAGGIKLIVDLGYSRFEINTPYSEKDYTDKRQHEVHMWRTGVNNEIIHLQVDNDTITSAALQFDFPSNIRFLFIGNNDTSSYSGFDGCLFGMSIDNIFLLKLASQNPRPSYITVYPNNTLKDVCSLDDTRWSQCQGGEMSNVHNYYSQFCFYKIEKLLTVVGTVPGNIYTSLINNNQIDDPYYRDNDDKYRWIAKDDWSYTRGFQVTSAMFSSQSLVLVCEGLDTVSRVFINGIIVGTSDNMFVRYVFDIKRAARVGTNNLTIVFSSPVKYAESESKLYHYAVPPVALVPEYHGENHVQFIRKCQCSFSWDWGPSFPAMGIWRDIYIQGYNNAVIRDVTAETLKGTDGTWKLSIEVFVEIPHLATVNGKLEARLDSTPVSLTVPVTFNEKNKSAVMQINIPKSVNIKEWWPNGYGNQTLYKLYTFFTGSNGQEMVGKSINIGFRTVEVVEDFVSSDHSQGTTFYFKINGQPVFFKGSNWIPADSFLDRVSKSRIENLLQSAKDANMNVLRVWGGGIYEMEEFYDIADRLGIMIWQDFMFGCSMYPTDPTFLNSVTEEVTHQVRRLKHRPSIVIWSGNNENEKALRQSWYNTDVNFTLYYNDYIKLYKDVIYKVVQKEDPNRPFIASSPTNGKESMAEGWVAKMPWDEHYGDIHEYKYMDPFFMPSSYRIPRFSSEYGLQSLPSYESLDAVLNNSDLYYWSDMLDHRQHHPFGMVEMMAEIIMYLRLPNNPDKQKLFVDQIYVTQIDQAIGMKTETEHYRRWQNKLDDKGRGLTMGAMYWMLNDIWQAPTWSSLEYSGKWKMLHYFAKNFFAPLLISPTQEGNNIEVYIVVDQIPSSVHRHPQTGQVHFKPITNLFAPWNPHPQSQNKPQSNVTSGTLFIQMYSWDSLTPLHTWTQNYNLQKTTDMVFQADVNTMMSTAGCIRTKNCFLYFHLGDPVNGPTNWFSLSTFKDAIGLQNVSIQIIDVKETVPMKEFNITLHSKAVAPFVWLDAYKTMGRFSDNGFLMVHTQKVVTFYAWNDISGANLKASLNVKSLMDIYF